MDFLIKIDREFPTFAMVDSQKLGFYGPLSFLLMEKSFYLFVREYFLFGWFAFTLTSLTSAPLKRFFAIVNLFWMFAR